MDWGDSGGGGFMNDSIADEPQQLTNTISVGGEERSKAIASVSVSQVVKFTRPNDGGLVIHGKKIYHVNLVGFVYEILDINPQKIHLLVDDYTAGGPLEVSHIIGDTGVPDAENDYSMFRDNDFSNPEISTKSLNKLAVGDYIRCVGVVKYNQDQPIVVAYHMNCVDDPNDITKHTLEVIRDSMVLERSHATGLTQTNLGKTTAPSNTTTNQGSKYQAKNDEFGRLSNREKLVLKFVRDRTDMTNDVGVPISDIAENLKAFKMADIQASLNTLNAEGLCWQGDCEDIWFANAEN